MTERIFRGFKYMLGSKINILHEKQANHNPAKGGTVLWNASQGIYRNPLRLASKLFKVRRSKVTREQMLTAYRMLEENPRVRC